ncbi:MAG: iron-only hydrogenase system regulator [Lachnospiraceae bacterium]|nr:iron-only hydrogenase system regulator [Lachnospiraceae bacterium]
MEERIAIIAIIISDITQSARLNELLSKYGQFIIGRMGLPHQHIKDKELALISIAIKAPQNEISALSGKIGMLKGIQSKVIYA